MTENKCKYKDVCCYTKYVEKIRCTEKNYLECNLSKFYENYDHREIDPELQKENPEEWFI